MKWQTHIPDMWFDSYYFYYYCYLSFLQTVTMRLDSQELESGSGPTTNQTRFFLQQVALLAM
jgi:hypothetical protein